MEYCQVRELEKRDFSLLFEKGLKINQSALTRQKRPGRRVFLDTGMWGRLLDACQHMSEICIYGAFFQNQLCAYLIIFQAGKLALCLQSFSSTQFLR